MIIHSNAENIKALTEAQNLNFFEKIQGNAKFNVIIYLGEHSTPEIISALAVAKQSGLFDRIPHNYLIDIISALGKGSTPEKIKALAHVNNKGLFIHNSLEGKPLVDTIGNLGLYKSAEEIYGYVRE